MFGFSSAPVRELFCIWFGLIQPSFGSLSACLRLLFGCASAFVRDRFDWASAELRRMSNCCQIKSEQQWLKPEPIPYLFPNHFRRSVEEKGLLSQWEPGFGFYYMFFLSISPYIFNFPGRISTDSFVPKKCQSAKRHLSLLLIRARARYLLRIYLHMERLHKSMSKQELADMLEYLACMEGTG